MAFEGIVRWILPKEDHFFDFLEEQAILAHECAVALARIKKEPPLEVKELVHEVEKRGDKVVHDMEDALARTFVTPLDREDLHKLCSQIDDVLDRAYATASAFVMFGIAQPSGPASELIDTLVEATLHLKQALPHLKKHDFEKIREITREIRVLEKKGDEIYRKAMTALFSGSGTEGVYGSSIQDARALIREKEVVEILEEAIDGCEDVAEFLNNLAVKHG
jgi:uncharacterized protein